MPVQPAPATIGTMIDAEHRREEPPVAFETATVDDAINRGVISCPPETPLRVVARIMTTHSVHAVFVFERRRTTTHHIGGGSSPTSTSWRQRNSISTS